MENYYRCKDEIEVPMFTKNLLEKNSRAAMRFSKPKVGDVDPNRRFHGKVNSLESHQSEPIMNYINKSEAISQYTQSCRP